MIDLTEEQRQSIRKGKAVRVRDNGHEYVVLDPDVFNRLSDDEYDDSPWTADGLDQLREESTGLLDNFGKNL
jgi:hypothetical protein